MGAATAVFDAANTGLAALRKKHPDAGNDVPANAGSAEARATRLEQEAGLALEAGERARAEHAARGRVDRAATRAGYARSGVKVDEGSALTVVADQAAWSEYGRRKLEYDAKLESWGLARDAAMLRGRPAAARPDAPPRRMKREE